MTGTSGSSFSGFSSTDTSCDSLVLDTHLSSPKEDVVDRIQVDDNLSIHVHKSGSLSTVQAYWHDELVGGIASPRIQRLLSCIDEGYTYVARVTAKNGGEVRVRLSPVSN
ncbi:hypothetical protein [Halomonas sp. NO4]|uniref:hypothetical protein n=1 Tax=Halomonas sp. NO4 TaxID=2484813 RepID=UPI0013D683B5|nr:hypothetical protein [Halomonas sp. NO4]